MSKPTDKKDTAKSKDNADKPDYRDTLFLPQTDFPMRAGLAKREPEFLKRWAEMGLYGQLRKAGKGREQFILHDGPPYANGQLHMGHALNKTLKDIVVRSQQMMGKDANYVPGWDCHGLPIEWEVEARYRKKGKNKDDVPVLEFRRECREFAAKWIDVQREEFKRLGIEGDWDNPYTTMSFDAEAQIVREFQKFVMNGGLYRGSKPVMWSVVEKTALAEAEVEYLDHVSPTIFVKFPIQATSDPALEGASVVIWTTTPWTIPGNRAVAFSEKIPYAVYEVEAVEDASLARVGEKLVLAVPLAESVASDAGITSWKRVADAENMTGTICAHPFRSQGYDFDVALYAGGFVTEETGTGFVHVAPGHGQDDFELGIQHNIDVPFTVDEEGRYYESVPLFAGKRVLYADGSEGDANQAVIDALKDAGALLAQGKLAHTYPHSWRSKAPLIFRNTPQWFISMDTNELRDKALSAIDDVRWVPPRGRERIRAMVETRPDWVVSRQRAWGVPLTLFVHKTTGELLRDEEVNERIAIAVAEEGADIWFEKDASAFLGNKYSAEDYEKVEDILDVWFDSGSSHAFVLEARDDLASPASLYLEGSDQHRGWFQSSLLESCGTRGRAPYEAVLTHGFVNDENGRKMSKSEGNVIQPQKIIDQNGVEILRLWVASSDYSADLRIGSEIIKSSVDAYRKLRNTLRFILGNLGNFEESERLDVSEMPELDRWVLHRLTELDAFVRQGYADYELNHVFSALFNFATVDLSAFYFDIRKDALYCDEKNSLRRRAARTVLDEVFSCLTAWLAPILCFTMEEVWLNRFPGDESSVHLRVFPDLPGDWQNEVLAQKWARVRDIRRVVTGSLEIERREKTIGASLEAAPRIYLDAAADQKIAASLDLPEVMITSGGIVEAGAGPATAFRLEDVDGVAVEFAPATGAKCQRCWMLLPEVGTIAAHSDLCGRCADVLTDGERIA